MRFKKTFNDKDPLKPGYKDQLKGVLPLPPHFGALANVLDT